MNKWDVKVSEDRTLSVYKDTLEEVLEYCNVDLKSLMDKKIIKEDITLDKKLKYMEYVNEITNNSDGIIYIKNKKHYTYKSDMGLIPINLWQEDEFYFDGCQYIEGTYDKTSQKIKAIKGKYTTPTGWIWSNPKEFLERFGIGKGIQFVQYSMRFYGQPKLIMPKELKGIKQWGNVNYILGKCACKVYIKDNDVWIKHRDYFSSPMEVADEDTGAPLGYLCKKYLNKDRSKKFIYPDAWGQIICRNEAWIKIENLIKAIKEDVFPPEVLNQILRSMERELRFEEYDLETGYTSRMFEQLISKLRKEYL